MWLAGCGGGEGTPRPDNAAGAGGSGATGGSGAGTGGSNAGTGGSAAGSGGMVADMCPTRMPKAGGVINALEAVGMEATDTEHRRFPTGDGGWFIFHASPDDAQCPTDTCMTTPPRNDHGEFALADTMPARDDSEKALHFVGTGFPSTAYGAGVGFYLDCASLGDAVTGVSFYYRSDIPVTFGIAMGLEGQSVDHTTTVPASPDEWAHAELPLTMLSPAINDRSVFGTMFWRLGVPTGTTADWGFDFWLDDISFTP
jgi:hypothetical protein